VRSMHWWRKHFGLSREQLWDLSRGAVGCDFFGGREEKERRVEIDG